jgi:hypothetical protein
MTDIIEEEHLDDSTDSQTDIHSDEIIPKQDTETINSTEEPENMEVHHHAHHEGKKN